MSSQKAISADLVAAALRAPSGCPPLERLAAAAQSELPDGELAGILRHAESCPTCAAELDLARSFGAELPVATSSEGEALAWIVDRLRPSEAGSAERPLASVVAIGARRATPAYWLRWGALAAALSAVGVGLALFLPERPPAVPTLNDDDVVRGGRIEIESGLGVLAEAPARIAWRAVPGAVRYRLEIVGVDDVTVAAVESEAPSIALASELRSRLETFVRYRVRISALDAAGARVATSDPVELRLEPDRR